MNGKWAVIYTVDRYILKEAVSQTVSSTYYKKNPHKPRPPKLVIFFCPVSYAAQIFTVDICNYILYE